MPTYPSLPFSHAHTRTHHQPDSSLPGLAQYACYKGLSVWIQNRLDPCPKDTYIHAAGFIIAVFVYFVPCCFLQSVDTFMWWLEVQSACKNSAIDGT